MGGRQSAIPGGHFSVHAFIFAVTLVCILTAFFYMNLHTPLMMDDYDYSFSWATGRPIDGIADIAASQVQHYRIWGGRSVTHALTQLFLYLGKPVFNAANTLALCAMFLCILILSGQSLSSCPWEQLLLSMMLLCTIPFFGTVFLWLDGACNYLWGNLLALMIFLVLGSCRGKGFFARGPAIPLGMILCLISGWTNENTACGILAALLLQMTAKRDRPSRTEILYFLCHAAGIALMLLAPGNFERASANTGGFLSGLGVRLIHAVYYYMRFTGILLLPECLLWIRHKTDFRSVPGNRPYLMASLLAGAALILSPEISNRTYTGCFLLLLIDLLSQLDLRSIMNRYGKAGRLLETCLAVVLIAVLIHGNLAVYRHEQLWNRELAKIHEAREQGREEVILSPVFSSSNFTMDISLAERSEEWPNSTLGKWFGIQIFGETGPQF